MKVLPFYSYSRFKMLFPKASCKERLEALRLFLYKTRESPQDLKLPKKNNTDNKHESLRLG